MRILTYNKTKGHFWFRLFGRGLLIKNIMIYPLLFSQRNGYTKGILIGKYWIEYVSKNYL